MPAEQPVSDVVETLETATQNDTVRLSDVLAKFGAASFPPLLLGISVLLVSPLSGIPFFSSVAGLLIFAVAIQGMLGRAQIALPRRLTRFKLNTERSERYMQHMRRMADWIDRNSTPRWPHLVAPPVSRVFYGIAALSGLCLPLLELVPFSSSLVGLSVVLIAAGLLTRDGLIACLGVVVLSVAAMIPVFAVSALVS